MTPRVETHAGFRVVRDDEQPGGTKARALPAFLLVFCKGDPRAATAAIADREEVGW